MSSTKTTLVDGNGKIIHFIPTTSDVVTPSDTTVLTAGVLFIGTGGDINVVPADGYSAVLFKNVADGTFLPLLVTKVYSTNTTAADIVICR